MARAGGKARIVKPSALPTSIGAALGGSLVLASLVLGHPGWGLLAHVDCVLEPSVGNTTVWVPSSVVAAPYLGWETGAVKIWTRSPSGYVSLTTDTNVTDGNVTAWLVGFENWTVSPEANVTSMGLAPNLPCGSAFVGQPSLNPPADLQHGGTTSWAVATDLTADTDVPTSLNGSALCEDVENSSNPNCGVGANYNLDFSRASGTVDTCDSVESKILRDVSYAWPVSAPYEFEGHSFLVPLNLSPSNSLGWSNGSTSWYNYTFPPDTGIWDYDNLSQTSSLGAGLAFTYSPCP